MDTDTEAARIEERLREEATPERAAHEKRYLKSDLEHLGTSVPAIRRVVKDFVREHPDLRREEIVALAKALWRVPVHERRMAAVELLDLFGDRLRAGDMALVELMIREARTWALVDGLAASVAGRLVDRFPSLDATLDRWAGDEDFWVRRSALLALLLPLRKGDGDFGRFARYADAMLEDREFFIRKAIGWVLRETSKRRPDLVFGWLRDRARRASGVTVREATKYLGESERREILEARSVPQAGT